MIEESDAYSIALREVRGVVRGDDQALVSLESVPGVGWLVQWTVVDGNGVAQDVVGGPSLAIDLQGHVLHFPSSFGPTRVRREFVRSAVGRK